MMKIDPNDKAALEAAVKNDGQKKASLFDKLKSLFDFSSFFKSSKKSTEEKISSSPQSVRTRPEGLKLNAKVLKLILIGFVSFTVFAMLYGVFKQRSFALGGSADEERVMTSVSPIKVSKNDRVRKGPETIYVYGENGSDGVGGTSSPGSSETERGASELTTEALNAGNAGGTRGGELHRGGVTPAVIAEQEAALARSQPPSLTAGSGRYSSDLSPNGESLDEARRSSLYPAGFDPKSVSLAQNQVESVGGNLPIVPAQENIVVAPYSTREMVSPYQIFQGTIIPMVLVTGICSDLPSQITARVLSDVYDSVSGRYIIIPSGSTVVGSYSNGVMWGQQRVLVVWDRLIRPDGSSVYLGGMNGVDMSGYAGYKDKVDLHIKELASLMVVSTIMNIASGQISFQASKHEQNKNALSGLIEGLSNSQQDATSTINQMAEKFLELQPTLTIRAGTRCNLFVNKDIILEPYLGY